MAKNNMLIHQFPVCFPLVQMLPEAARLPTLVALAGWRSQAHAAREKVALRLTRGPRGSCSTPDESFVLHLMICCYLSPSSILESKVSQAAGIRTCHTELYRLIRARVSSSKGLSSPVKSVFICCGQLWFCYFTQ